MKTITFECEVITPMFLSGADGKIPELRPPSIKGAMRFWWRAMNGHLVKQKENGTWDYSKLKEEEVKIFGGSYKDFNSNNNVKLKSKVVIEIIKKNIDVKENYKDDNNLQTYFNKQKKRIDGQDMGVSYLLYSVLVHPRSYIKEGSNFDINFIFYDEEIIEEVIKAFWLLSVFGGLGTRSRRGAGSFFVKKIESECNLKSWFNIQDKNFKYMQFFKDKIQDFQSNFEVHIAPLNDIRNNSKSALNRIGKLYANYRLDNNFSLLKRGNMGLPILAIASKKEVNAKNFERRASQIHISIIPIKEKRKLRYAWTVFYLKDHFLPVDEMIVLKDTNDKEKKIVNSTKPDETFVNNFLNSLPK